MISFDQSISLTAVCHFFSGPTTDSRASIMACGNLSSPIQLSTVSWSDLWRKSWRLVARSAAPTTTMSKSRELRNRSDKSRSDGFGIDTVMEVRVCLHCIEQGGYMATKVACGWAGAVRPKTTKTKKWLTDGPADRWTYKAGCRVA